MELVSIGEFARRSRLSPKALRLYDELALLVPASVDPVSGYRWYDTDQLETAHFVAALRQLAVPLVQIKAILQLDNQAATRAITAYWQGVQTEHASRSTLVDHLVNTLNGKRSSMYTVTVRDVPQRHLLCDKRHVTSYEEVFAIGKEFISLFRDNPALRDKPVPRFADGMGDAFLVYYGQVNEDSDGPIEWCRRVPDNDADDLSAALPSLTLRTEPAHREAFIHLGMQLPTTAEWQVVSDSLYTWIADNEEVPSDLAVRIAIRATGPSSDESHPDFDFAAPLR